MFINIGKEEKTKINNGKELAKYIHDMASKVSDINEDDQEKTMARIMAKLKAGAKLTREELDFLKKYNPMLYAQVMRIQRMAEAVADRLKNAKSKEEANGVVFGAISGISDKDPCKEYLVAAINRVASEFRNSESYSRLPNTIDEAEEKKGKTGDKVPDKKDEIKEEDFDLENWSPLNEVYEQLPTFSVSA